MDCDLCSRSWLHEIRFANVIMLNTFILYQSIILMGQTETLEGIEGLRSGMQIFPKSENFCC